MKRIAPWISLALLCAVPGCAAFQAAADWLAGSDEGKAVNDVVEALTGIDIAVLMGQGAALWKGIEALNPFSSRVRKNVANAVALKKDVSVWDRLGSIVAAAFGSHSPGKVERPEKVVDAMNDL